MSGRLARVSLRESNHPTLEDACHEDDWLPVEGALRFGNGVRVGGVRSRRKGVLSVRRCVSVLMALSTVVASVLTGYAHHAFTAEFDANKPVTLRGVVTKIELINPHAWIHLDVKNDEGSKVENWAIELGAPNALFRRGWRRDSLPIGTEIVAEGYRALDGSTKANGRDVTFPDGSRLFVGSSGTGAPDSR